ncbi:hypothetical protein, partial [Aeromonas salmonicida]|uniref:hypothetical protein n=1 Tax=Aeromonas salmonicida TaxID=645 RepID=UPI003671CD9A
SLRKSSDCFRFSFGAGFTRKLAHQFGVFRRTGTGRIIGSRAGMTRAKPQKMALSAVLRFNRCFIKQKPRINGAPSGNKPCIHIRLLSF